MKHKHTSLILVAGLILFLLGSCVPDEFKKDYNTDMLVEPYFKGPVAYGSLSIEDILENADTTGNIFKDTNDLLYVAFREHLDDIIAGEWIEIPDQQFVQIYYDYPLPVPADSLFEFCLQLLLRSKNGFWISPPERIHPLCRSHLSLPLYDAHPAASFYFRKVRG